MTSPINGFAADGFGDFEIEKFYAKAFPRVTNEHNYNLRTWGEVYIDQEVLFFPDIKRETLLEDLKKLEKKSAAEYQRLLSLYRLDCQSTVTSCRFTTKLLQDDCPDAKCQLNQLITVVIIKLQGDFLANRMKMHVFMMVAYEPSLRRHYLHLFGHLQTWPRYAEETLEAQLLREISIIPNPRLTKIFADYLTKFVPKVNSRLLLYKGCASFGSRNCLVCGDNFSKTVLEAFPLPNLEKNEKKIDPCLAYEDVFRTQFYLGLVNFLKIL